MPVLTPNITHQDLNDGNIWALAGVLGGGMPDATERPHAQGPAAVALLHRELTRATSEAQAKGLLSSCAYCGQEGTFMLRIDEDNEEEEDETEEEEVEDEDEEAWRGGQRKRKKKKTKIKTKKKSGFVLAPLLALDTNFTTCSYHIRGFSPACCACRTVAAPNRWMARLVTGTLRLTRGGGEDTLGQARDHDRDHRRLIAHACAVNDVAGLETDLARASLVQRVLDTALSGSAAASKWPDWTVCAPRERNEHSRKSTNNKKGEKTEEVPLNARTLAEVLASWLRAGGVRDAATGRT